ncbi:Cytochrome P450 CYP736A12 [Vitis vinifera]|uniref:Cytochrome P450 CYP736A12 n=1 Tax=Vitis vinifera TaxID=29760 RepID=A0A438F5C2_VITVI|nr:Cytochrome P450 CYP736A12 [Vitis vinifera]
MDWSWIALSLIALAYVVRALLNISKNKHKRLPPGPRGIPILGNLHMLAEQFLKTNDLVFAGRPPHEVQELYPTTERHILYRLWSLLRNMRKLCTLGLLSNLRISSFQPLRREELDLLIKSLKEAALARTAVDLSAKISSLSADMSCRMIFGKKYMDKDIDERGFKAVFRGYAISWSS